MDRDVYISYQGPPKPVSKNKSILPQATPQRFSAQEPLIRTDLTYKKKTLT